MQTLQKLIPLIYDTVTLILILSMIFSCAARGFLRTIVAFLGYCAAMFGAAACAKPLAQIFYQTFIAPPLIRNIETRINAVQPELLPESLLTAVQQFPQFLFEAVGLSQEEMVSALRDLVENGGARAAQSIADAVIAPLVIMLLKSIIFLLIFGVALFFVHKLADLFGGVNRLPVIGPANRILGGVVGFFQAALTLYVVVLVFNLILTFTGGQIEVRVGGQTLVLASSALFKKTYLFKLFLNFNPLDLLLSANQAGLGQKLQQTGDLFV